jgi:glycosyltransferase involved in cell wall biosynthesis
MINALVLSHDAKDLGGVGNFIRILRQRLRPTTTIVRFINGRRAGEISRLSKIRRIIGDYIRFAAVVFKERFDLVHFNPEMDLRSFPRESLFMLILLLMGQRNFIVFFRGWNWDEFNEIVNHRPLLRRWLFYALNRACKVIVLSKGFQKALIDNGVASDRVDVVTTMFDGRLLEPKERSDEAQLTAPMLLFMARFVKEKGVYQLLEAVALLKNDFPKLTLMMGGDGPEMEGLQQRADALGIADRVMFPGYLRRKEKASAFAAATVFVFPSYFWEGLPNAVLEAMGSGLPIIANPIAGVPEVMNDPDNGLFLSEVTADDIAKKLRIMLNDPALWPLYPSETWTRPGANTRHRSSADESRKFIKPFNWRLKKPMPGYPS